MTAREHELRKALGAINVNHNGIQFHGGTATVDIAPNRSLPRSLDRELRKVIPESEVTVRCDFNARTVTVVYPKR